MELLNTAFCKGCASALDCFSSLSPNEHCPQWVSKEVAYVLQMRTDTCDLFIRKDTTFRQNQGWIKQHTHTHTPLRIKGNPSFSHCQIYKTK